MSDAVQAHNEKARAVWNAPAGRYDEISRTLVDALDHAVERLAPAVGERILDLATGTGWTSRVVARREPAAKIVGVDIADRMLESARERATREGLAITYQHGDAERLPFEDRSFDAVISTFGVMFASKPDAAAAELARVVRPGGRVVLATWAEDGAVSKMFGVMRPFMAAAPAQSPFAWGNHGRVRELLGGSFELGFETGTNPFRYGSAEQAWRLWVECYGPIRTLAGSLDDAGRAAFKRALDAFHESYPSPLGYEQPRAYLVTRAIRKA